MDPDVYLMMSIGLTFLAGFLVGAFRASSGEDDTEPESCLPIVIVFTVILTFLSPNPDIINALTGAFVISLFGVLFGDGAGRYVGDRFF